MTSDDEIQKRLDAVRRHAEIDRDKAEALASARETEGDIRAADLAEHGERATRNQAIRAAKEAGASIAQIASAADLSEVEVEQIAEQGPFGT